MRYHYRFADPEMAAMMAALYEVFCAGAAGSDPRAEPVWTSGAVDTPQRVKGAG